MAGCTMTVPLRSAAVPFTPQEALLARAEMFYSQAPRTTAEPAEPGSRGRAPPAAAPPRAAEGAGVLAGAAAADSGAAEQQGARPRGHRVRLDRLVTGCAPQPTAPRRPPQQQWRPGAPAPRCAQPGPKVPPAPRRMPSRTPSPERAECQPQRSLAAGPCGRAARPTATVAAPPPLGGPRALALSAMVQAPAWTPPSTEQASYASQAQDALFLGDHEGLDTTEQDDQAQDRFQEFMYLRTAKPTSKGSPSAVSTTTGGSSRSSHLNSPRSDPPRAVSLASVCADTAANPANAFVSAAQDFLVSLLGPGKVQAGAKVPADSISVGSPEEPSCGVSTCGEDGEDLEDPEAVPVKHTFIHFDDHAGSKGAGRAGSSAKRETSAPAVMSRVAFHLKFPAMEEAHIRGDCRPCAYYLYKRDGCRRGDECSYCHLCTEGGRKKRRKERRGLY